MVVAIVPWNLCVERKQTSRMSQAKQLAGSLFRQERVWGPEGGQVGLGESEVVQG